MESRVLPAKIEQWDTVLELVDLSMEDLSFSEREKNHIRVSAEEIFTNIVSYAYGSEGGNVEVSCGMNEEDVKEFWISFKDCGVPYNPLEYPDPDFDIPLDERRVGGLGIYMVKKFMDRVEYRNENGCNMITIGKKL